MSKSYVPDFIGDYFDPDDFKNLQEYLPSEGLYAYSKAVVTDFKGEIDVEENIEFTNPETTQRYISNVNKVTFSHTVDNEGSIELLSDGMHVTASEFHVGNKAVLSSLSTIESNLATVTQAASDNYNDIVTLDTAVSSNDSDILSLQQDVSSLQTDVAGKTDAAYVDSQISALISTAPATLDTLAEISAAMNNDPDFYNSMNTLISGKADIASPSFTGTASFSSIPNASGTVTQSNDLTTKSYVDSAITGSAPTLQEVYDNSATNPDIVVSNTAGRGSLVIQQDPGAVVGHLMEFKDSVGVRKSLIAANGNIECESLICTSLTNGTVSNTEVNHLSGVTSGIQGQIDTKAPINNPTFTGTVGGVTKSMVGLGSVDDTSDLSKPVSTATQNALNLKANLNSPNFTGIVSGITSSMVGLGSVDNTADIDKPISSSVSTALSGKLNVNNPVIGGIATFTSIPNASGTVSSSNDLTTKTYVDDAVSGVAPTLQEIYDNSATNPDIIVSNTAGRGSLVIQQDAGGVVGHLMEFKDSTGTLKSLIAANGNIDCESLICSSFTNGTVSNTEVNHLSGVTSGIQGQIDTKAPINSPTFTGTVSGITSSMVGLGSVDNTSDLSKPVSTATQSALNLKAPINNASFTGTFAFTGASDGSSNHKYGCSLPNLTTGTDNMAIGTGSLDSLTTGIGNTAISAKNAGKNITTQSYNTLVGFNCGQNLDGQQNCVYGASTLANTAEAVNYACIYGFHSCYNLGGDANYLCAYGFDSGYSLTSGGASCTFVGGKAGRNATTTHNSFAFGYEAGTANSAKDITTSWNIGVFGNNSMQQYFFSGNSASWQTIDSNAGTVTLLATPNTVNIGDSGSTIKIDGESRTVCTRSDVITLTSNVSSDIYGSLSNSANFYWVDDGGAGGAVYTIKTNSNSAGCWFELRKKAHHSITITPDTGVNTRGLGSYSEGTDSIALGSNDSYIKMVCFETNKWTVVQLY